MRLAQGAAGDISTRLNRRERAQREVDRLGSIVAAGTERALGHAERVSGGLSVGFESGGLSLGFERATVDLPLKAPDQSAPLPVAGPTARDENDRSEAALLEEAMVAQRARQAGTRRPEAEAEISVLRIGDLRLCFVPGEPFESIERGVVEKTGQNKLRVVGYSNGAPGYVFTPAEELEGGYEVLSSPLTGGAGPHRGGRSETGEFITIAITGGNTVENEKLAYLSTVKALLDELSDDEEPILLAAQWCADTVAGGGLVHVFGAGHSHMAAEEAFHRAGGLVPVNAVLVEWLMVHQGGRRASLLERQPGLGELIVSTEPVEEGDVFFVVSNSGRNPVPVEVAEAAKRRGAKVVAVTSKQHSAGVTACRRPGRQAERCGRPRPGQPRPPRRRRRPGR